MRQVWAATGHRRESSTWPKAHSLLGRGRACSGKDGNITYTSASSQPLWSHGWVCPCPAQWPPPTPPAQSSPHPGVCLKPAFWENKGWSELGLTFNLEGTSHPHFSQFHPTESGKCQLFFLGASGTSSLPAGDFLRGWELKYFTTCLEAAPSEGLREARIQRPRPAWGFH